MHATLFLRKLKSWAGALFISDLMAAEISVFSERRISDFSDLVTSEFLPGLSDRGGEVAVARGAMGLVFAAPVYLYLRRFAAIHSDLGFLPASTRFLEQLGQCFNTQRAN